MEKVEIKVKKPYEPPKAVVVLFDDEDVITTSGEENTYGIDADSNNPVANLDSNM